MRSSLLAGSGSERRETKGKALSKLVRDDGEVAAKSADRSVFLLDLPSLDLDDLAERPDLMERFDCEELVHFGTMPRSDTVWVCDSGVG